MSDIETKTYPPEFLQRLIADHEAEQAGATTEESSAVEATGDAMSEIKRFTSDDHGYMFWSKEGKWVRYQDHLAEVERLIAERDNAQAGDDVALSALTSALRERDAAQAEVERLMAEVERLQNSANVWQHDAQQLALKGDSLKRELHEIRPEAHRLRAEVKRLNAELAEAHERCRALELSIKQADEMKAHAEASAAAEEAETDRVTAERDAAQAEVERLTQELEGRRATNQRVMAERDAAKREAERLQTLLTVERGELITLRDSLRVLRANGQGMLDTSRPTDEDIWREAFMVQLMKSSSYQWERSSEEADLVLATYRKRWPR